MPDPFGSGGATGGDHDSPMKRKGISTRKPAIGPANPMSKRTRRFGNGSRILMNAPRVPVIGSGAGRKNGSVASTLW